MSLFPAYSSQNDTEDQPSRGPISFKWLQNESCPPEVGLIPLPPPAPRETPQEETPKEENAEVQEIQELPQPISKKKKKKEKKKKKKKKKSVAESDGNDKKEKKKKRKKKHSDASSSLSSSSRSRSRSPNIKGHRSRSVSVSKEQLKLLKKKPKKRSLSRSKERSNSKSRKRKSRTRSRSRSRSRISSRSSSKSRSGARFRSDSEEKGKLRSHARSRSRTRTRARRRSRSQSRRRKSRSRSGSRSQSRKRSRSRDRKRLRSRSLSRKRSRSRDRKRLRSRSLSRKRSRSRDKRSRRSSSLSRKRSRSRDRQLRRSRSLSRKRSRSRGNSRDRHGTKSKGSFESKSSSEIIVSGSKSVFLRDLNGLVKPEDAFHIETSGDKNNLIFSTTHFSQLVRYRVKNRRILGSSYSRGDNPGRKKKPLRYFKRTAQKALYCNAELIKSLPHKFQEPASGGDSGGYIPLELTFMEINEIKTEKNRTNQPKYGVEQFLLELDSDDEDKSEGVEYAFWQRKLKEYNEKLGKEPSNIDLWLEFVRFQDKSYSHLFNVSEDRKDEKKKKVSLKALAERKISILDSAIKKNIRSLDLQFERLTIGQDIWDDKKIKQEWGSLIFNFPNKLEVWHRYLAFTQTHFTSFSLTNVVNTFAKCTEKLQQMKSGVFITHAPPPELGKCLVDVAVQLAYLWKQAGYMERSIALFQALIELNLFAPAHARSKYITLEARLALFEPFWDSRAPRFGEENAIGWAQVMEKRQQMEFPEVVLGGTQDEEDVIIAKGGATSNLWLALESSRERRHWLPWEQDPEDCEDPERMVSFEDLSSHLFILDTAEENLYLVLQFLKFLGVPNAHNLISQRKSTSKSNAKSQNDKVCDIFKPLTVENLLDDKLFGRTRKLEDFFGDGGRGILNFPEIGPTVLNSSCVSYYTFLCELLQQVSNVIQQPVRTDLTILYMKLLGLKFVTMKADRKDNLASVSKDLKKKVKNILKLEEFRACLPIYQEYGRLEEIMEHYDDSENVFTTALTIGTAAGRALDVSNPNFKDIMELFTSYVELQMKRESESGDGYYSNNVIYSLASLVLEGKFIVNNGSPATGSIILRAKKQLIEMQNSNLLAASEDNCNKEKDGQLLFAAKLTSFLALLQLLTVGFKSACSVYETSIQKIKDGFDKPVPHKLEDISLPGERPKVVQLPKRASPLVKKPHLLEIIIEEFLWLVEVSSSVDHVVRGERMAPVHMRSVLASAVKASPENPNFLLQFALNQTWRDLLGGTEILSQNSSSILVSVSRILPHVQRTVTLISNTDEGLLSCGHRMESVLERAVSCLPGRHCPLMWRLYLALVATTRPSGLKSLLYRALASCPGVKSVYLDCIRLMPEMLKEIVTLLGEKGIRVRLPLEELQVLTETEVDMEEV